MANQEHLDILMQGVDAWNKWREEHPDIRPDLSDAELQGANLSGANLSKANLREAHLNEAILIQANLSGASFFSAHLQSAQLIKADLSGASFRGAHLGGANLTGANLRKAKLSKTDLSSSNLKGVDLTQASLREANLSEARLRGANLNGAYLKGANLVRTDLTKAILTNCSIYGISAWDVQMEEATQLNLVITRPNQPTITVDNLKVAQFIYLLLNNKEIRDVIDTITSKVVLILGRFTPKRKAILEALKEELRRQNYSPVVFDFDRPENRDFTETARTLAHLSRFILADITEPSSIPQELQAIVPDLEVPVQPLLEEGKKQYAMFPDFGKYPWVFPIYPYKDQASLITSLKNEIIDPADKKARELAIEKARRLERP